MLSNLYILYFEKGKGYKNIFIQSGEEMMQSIVLKQNFNELEKIEEIVIDKKISVLYKKINYGYDEYNRNVYLMAATLVRNDINNKTIINNDLERIMDYLKTTNQNSNEIKDYIEKNFIDEKDKSNLMFTEKNKEHVSNFTVPAKKNINERIEKHRLKKFLLFISIIICLLGGIYFYEMSINLKRKSKEVSIISELNKSEIKKTDTNFEGKVIRDKRIEIENKIISNGKLEFDSDEKVLTNEEIKEFLQTMKSRVTLPNFYYSFLNEILKYKNDKISEEDLRSFYINNKPQQTDLKEFKSYELNNNEKIYEVIDSYLPIEFQLKGEENE